MRLFLKDSAATEAAGAALGSVLPASETVIYLQGDLGAGKTTLVRGLLHALGHQGRVPSPTYTLVEPYELAGRSVRHLDLYRLADPEELAYLGIRDMAGILLIEWPEKGAHFLPPADLVCRLAVSEDGRSLVTEAQSDAGRALQAAWEAANHKAGL
ncbi:MAG: tRNA (adenosine(37)-N6)-threonylcarbamoyltransferase complex ATPase subunit type 1 TsaE [Bacillota bacterium]